MALTQEQIRQLNLAFLNPNRQGATSSIDQANFDYARKLGWTPPTTNTDTRNLNLESSPFQASQQQQSLQQQSLQQPQRQAPQLSYEEARMQMLKNAQAGKLTSEQDLINQRNQLIQARFNTKKTQTPEDLIRLSPDQQAALRSGEVKGLETQLGGVESGLGYLAKEREEEYRRQQEEQKKYEPQKIGNDIVQLNKETGKYDVIYTAPKDIDTQVVTAGGRSLLINTQTGETIKDIGRVYKNTGGKDGITPSLISTPSSFEEFKLAYEEARQMNVETNNPELVRLYNEYKSTFSGSTDIKELQKLLTTADKQSMYVQGLNINSASDIDKYLKSKEITSSSPKRSI